MQDTRNKKPKNKELIAMKAIEVNKLLEEIDRELNEKCDKIKNELVSHFDKIVMKNRLIKQVSTFDKITFGLCSATTIATGYLLYLQLFV